MEKRMAKMKVWMRERWEDHGQTQAVGAVAAFEWLDGRRRSQQLRGEEERSGPSSSFASFQIKVNLNARLKTLSSGYSSHARRPQQRLRSSHLLEQVHGCICFFPAMLVILSTGCFTSLMGNKSFTAMNQLRCYTPGLSVSEREPLQLSLDV